MKTKIFIIIILFFFSCKGNVHESKEFSNNCINYLQKINNNNDFQNAYFIIIPQNSCHGCQVKILNSINKFYTSERQNLTVIYVGTNVELSNEQKAKLEKVSLLIDENEYYHHKDNQLIETYYPVFISIENNKLKNYFDFKAENIEKKLNIMHDIFKNI